MTTQQLLIKTFNNAEYQQTHEAMLNRTLERVAQKKQGLTTADELWIVEHQDVYTLGQAGKESHILARNNTPIIKTDRGGQVTWHGTGQLVMYWLFDLTELNWKVRDLVSHAEQAIEDVINDDLKLTAMAQARQDAPGVYLYTVDTARGKVISDMHANQSEQMIGKIASLGFKIKQGFSYHGIAINISCDLTPFSMINPCGYAGMQMVRVIDFLADDSQLDKQKVDSDGDVNIDNYIDNNIDSDITNMLVRNILLRHSNMTALRN